MAMDTNRVPFYAFKTRSQAEEAIRLIDQSGFDVKKLSLIGKGFHSEQHPIGFYATGDRIRHWGGVGAFWGGIWGLLLAPAIFFLPGLGIIAMAGPIVAALVGAVEGAVVVGGVSALCGALISVGVPREDAIKYESMVKADGYVLTVHGSDAELAAVRATLQNMAMREAA